MKRWLWIGGGILAFFVIAFQCRPAGSDPALVGLWRSLDDRKTYLLFCPNGEGYATADPKDPYLAKGMNFTWSIRWGRLTTLQYDEEGRSYPHASAEYMIRQGVLTLVGELPEDWSAAYRFDRSLKSIPGASSTP